MSATAARQAALRVLRALRGGELLDRAIRREIDALADRDRAWARELVAGTVRLRGRLDALLATFSNLPLDSLDADVLDALRLGACQLLEMDSVPDYAAVSQSVELIKVEHPGGARLVNAVLQALRRSGPPRTPPFEADPATWMTEWGSHPRWLVERWIERYGVDAGRCLVETNNSRAPLYLRPVGTNVRTALDRLAEAGVAAVATGFADTIRLDQAGQVESALAATPAIVQDPAAAAVADFADFEGGIIADLCAAPGGKTVDIAGGTNRASPVYVVAADASPGRLKRLRRTLDRLPPMPVGIVAADARRPALGPVDGVLVDAPCTGTGTFRRHVDGKWRLSPGDVMDLAALQSQILEAAAGIVRPGGLLVYATCSLEREENDDRVEAFLETHREFEIEPSVRTDPALLDNGVLRILPHVHGFDGSFAARMRRR